MRYALSSGILWGLDTVVLGVALAAAIWTGRPELAFAFAVAGPFVHDTLLALWLMGYMGLKKRLKDTLTALKTRSALIVMLGALLGGPLGMTGYVVAINHIGPAYTAIISAFYPAFGAALSVVVLKEKLLKRQIGALLIAIAGVIGMGVISTESALVDDPLLGLAGAALAVVGWGSEAVLCAWGMRDDDMDSETALHIRSTTSALVYGLIVLPLVGGWQVVVPALSDPSLLLIGAAALAGAASYLFYYRGIQCIGAARAMALNVSYSAWAVVFGSLAPGASLPSAATIVCCAVVLVGTILAASNWNELLGQKQV